MWSRQTWVNYGFQCATTTPLMRYESMSLFLWGSLSRFAVPTLRAVPNRRLLPIIGVGMEQHFAQYLALWFVWPVCAGLLCAYCRPQCTCHVHNLSLCGDLLVGPSRRVNIHVCGLCYSTRPQCPACVKYLSSHKLKFIICCS